MASPSERICVALRCAHGRELSASVPPACSAPPVRRACEAETGALHRDLSSALEAVLHHKLAVQAALKEARDRVAALRAEVAAAAA